MLGAYKAMTNMLMTDYSEIALPRYLHEDLYDNCDDDGNCTTTEYWTKTAFDSPSYEVWTVGPTGTLGIHHLLYSGNKGSLRPVTWISKSLMSQPN